MLELGRVVVRKRDGEWQITVVQRLAGGGRNSVHMSVPTWADVPAAAEEAWALRFGRDEWREAPR